MTDTNHTDSVEATTKEKAIAITVRLETEIFKGRFSSSTLEEIEQVLLEELTPFQATQSQQVEEAVRKMFNLNELEKEWQEQFYESEWHPDTLKKTQLEKDIEKELGTFLPRHMDVYDWNLPYIDFITLVIRKHIKEALTPNHQD